MKEQSIKNIGESLAFTSKGLFKTADILKLEYKILLWTSILISICTLTFHLNDTLSKCLGIVSVAAAIWLLVGENSQHKVMQYMSLGNDFLNLYNEVERCYHNGVDLPDDIHERRAKLNAMTNELSISWLAKKLVDKIIYKEMNLGWISERHEG